MKPTKGFVFTKDFFSRYFLFCSKTVRKQQTIGACWLTWGVLKKPTSMLFEVFSESRSVAMLSLKQSCLTSVLIGMFWKNNAYGLEKK